MALRQGLCVHVVCTDRTCIVGTCLQVIVVACLSHPACLIAHLILCLIRVSCESTNNCQSRSLLPNTIGFNSRRPAEIILRPVAFAQPLHLVVITSIVRLDFSRFDHV